MAGLILMMYHGQDPSWVNTARISNGGRFEDRHVEAAFDVLSLTPYFGFMVTPAVHGSCATAVWELHRCVRELHRCAWELHRCV